MALPAERRGSRRSRSDKLREVAAEFDSVHTVERALQVGSIDAIIPLVSDRISSRHSSG